MNQEKRLKKHVRLAIATIIERIDKTPLDGNTATQLARDSNVNRKTLQEGFKDVMGMGIKEYLIHKRMEIARQLLLQEEKSVKEIALTCLYKSQSAFTTAFKKMHGVTPSEWQQRNVEW